MGYQVNYTVYHDVLSLIRITCRNFYVVYDRNESTRGHIWERSLYYFCLWLYQRFQFCYLTRKHYCHKTVQEGGLFTGNYTYELPTKATSAVQNTFNYLLCLTRFQFTHTNIPSALIYKVQPHRLIYISAKAASLIYHTNNYLKDKVVTVTHSAAFCLCSMIGLSVKTITCSILNHLSLSWVTLRFLSLMILRRILLYAFTYIYRYELIFFLI